MALYIKNARIATMDRARPFAAAAVVDGPFFAYVGDAVGAEEYLREHPLPNLETLDAGGRLMTPGLNDSHMHYLHYVRSSLSVDLAGAASLEELLSRMRHGLKQRPPQNGLWLSGSGWNQDFFTEGERRFPTADDLDTVSREVPIFITRACSHVGVLNSKALALLGIDAESVKQYGSFAGTRADGTPNGVLTELVLDGVKPKIPAPGLDELVEMACARQGDLFRCGITSVQSDDRHYAPPGTFYDLLYRLRDAGQNGKLRLRIAEQARFDTTGEMEDFFAHGFGGDFGNAHFNVAAMKLMSDGSLGAWTAYMREAYLDDPSTRGLPNYTQAELDALVGAAHRNNMPAVIHAIGDAAIDMCLDAIEKARRERPHLHPRHGIIHCQITHPAQVMRFKELDVAAYTQPIFIANDMHVIRERVGGALAETSYAWRDYRRIGVVQSFGTDCPVEPFAPLPNLYAAATRRDLSGAGPYLPGQALPLYECLYNYTAAGAWCSGEEHIKGRVAPGMLADFVIFDRDLLAVPHEELLEAQVWQTWLGGEAVYQS